MHSVGLRLEGFGVAFGTRIVLRTLTVEFPRRGMSVLLGPVASGKSTLLRTLAGLNHAQPELRIFGSATWGGVPLFDAGGVIAAPVRVALVMQKARFFVDSVRENLVSALPNRSALDRATQSAIVFRLLEDGGLHHLGRQLEREVVDLPNATQRHLAIIRAIAAEPEVLLADEPTAGLEPEQADAILAVLRSEAARRCVVLVTHNQEHARRAGGTTHLLVDGRIEESGPTEEFFIEPRTAHGRRFVRTGGCIGPSSDTDSTQPIVQQSKWSWPRGFLWLVRNEIGGLPRPGILGDMGEDLRGLSRLGVRVLVGLEEDERVPKERLAEHGLDFLHFPTPDMQAPDVGRALLLCGQVERYVAESMPVAFHCRAGLGRTGTMLACQLVWRGRTLAQAIETVRGMNPRCIQSQTQVAFLRDFEIGRRAAKGG